MRHLIPISLLCFLAVTLHDRFGIAKAEEYEPVDQKTDADDDFWNRSGLQLRVGAGGSFWAGREMDMNLSHGGQVNVLAGYRLNGWISLDGGGVFALMSRESEPINLSEQLYSWFAVHAGTRVFLLGRQRPVDIYAGFHFGYAQAFRKRYSNSFYNYLHGISFAESLGFEAHICQEWSIGIDFTILNPLWLQECSESDAGDEICFEYGETEEPDDWKKAPLMFNLGFYASAVFG